MRIATYNVEWFSSLFDDDNVLLEDTGPSGRKGVSRAQQSAALGHVFGALDADAIMVVEAPDQGRRRDTVLALEHFARRFGLRANRALIGFANSTQQEIALLYDPARLTVVHDPGGEPSGPDGATGAPRFDGVLRIDLDVDAKEDHVVFSKPPLELSVQTEAGRRLRMIGAHLKSKAPHGARSRDDVMRISIANRRKQLAQAIWLRRRIEVALAAGEDVMLLGDLNDGPGLDAFEDLFGRSSVEILMGTNGGARMYDPHAEAALRHKLAAQPTTARFHIENEGRYLNALLDYVMVSDGLRLANPRWRIWHPFEDQACWQQADLRQALLTASDHFPVVLDIDI
ncbi:endonuclease/exonuclease/phosphatase family protein [Shimia marina]|uniref:Endonuclease/Exonuclease/phosphatase family protein n=1 Tax=Shimia marina TaxID=321267 RepID=A0A0P1FBK5_9RHOB|nr:endonuclease/exonuclease/phosphatase family protein [Shimia marina]CUH52821.1 Endonuclease/Exonuclease/phosphatase family protein [Shimia marina]SFD88354.1 Endonuclease/Exonuclease/phosphatase family protein [Shimia marina]